jgi:hypothetical protein
MLLTTKLSLVGSVHVFISELMASHLNASSNSHDNLVGDREISMEKDCVREDMPYPQLA